MPESLNSFVARRSAAWDELKALGDAARSRRGGGIGAADARRLGAHYRAATADLATARRRWADDPVTTRLDALVRATRPLVYRSVQHRASLLEFATTGYWRRIRERPRFLAIAAAFLFGPALAIGLWAHSQPAAAARIAQASPATAGIADGDTRDPDRDQITDPAVGARFSSEIATNNARVALMAYAGGLTGGAVTVLSLVFNGLVLGLIAGLVVDSGQGEAFWRLVVPHGVLELSLITVAGAAGFRTGWALLRPGHRTRAQALATEGRAGVEIALGTAFLLFPTGLVEGFVTPRGLSLPAALAVGVTLGAVFWGLVLWRGRPAQSRAAALSLR